MVLRCAHGSGGGVEPADRQTVGFTREEGRSPGPLGIAPAVRRPRLSFPNPLFLFFTQREGVVVSF